MDNTKLLEQYLDKNVSESSKQDVGIFLNKIVDYCNINNMSLLNVSEDDINKIYSNEVWSAITKKTKKYFILSFLKYCGNIKVTQNLNISCKSKRYFYSFEEIERKLEPYFNGNYMNANSTYMAACILAWYFHIDKDSFTGIKKTDIEIKDNNVIRVLDREVCLPERLYKFFINYYYSASYKGADDRKIQYSDDIYFIKIKYTNSKNNKTIGINLNNRKLRMFTRISALNLSYPDIYWSGIFYEYRRIEEVSSDISFYDFILILDDKQDKSKLAIKKQDYINYLSAE